MVFLYALVLAAQLHDAGGASSDPADISVLDAIDCRLDAPSYTGFAMAVDGKDGLAQTRRWRKVVSTNAFMNEYDLPAPITVAGSYSTRRIGFTANSILAIIDVPDPAVVGRAEHIDNLVDAEPMIDALVATGKVSRAQAEASMPFRKFLGTRIVSDVTEPAGEGESFGSHTVVAHTISNATTHPGQTFYGCSYSITVLETDGIPL